VRTSYLVRLKRRERFRTAEGWPRRGGGQDVRSNPARPTTIQSYPKPIQINSEVTSSTISCWVRTSYLVRLKRRERYYSLHPCSSPAAQAS